MADSLSKHSETRKTVSGQWRVFSIRGTDISLDASWLIIFAFVTYTTATSIIPVRLANESFRTAVAVEASELTLWLAGVVTSVLFFTSILLHEAAHAVVAIRTGIPVRRIRLFIFGGVAEIESEPSRPGQEFVITIVGPLTSAALGGLFIVLAGNFPAVSIPHVTMTWLGQMNLVLAVFNMLPGFPLDGGRILRSMVWAFSGNFLRATGIASFIGSALGVALIVYGLAQLFMQASSVQSIWTLLIGWLLWSSARGGYKDAKRRERLKGVRVHDVLHSDTGAVPDNGTVQEFMERGLYHDRSEIRPVVDPVGCLVGVLVMQDIVGIPVERRAYTLLREAARSVDAAPVIEPNESLENAFNRAREEGVRRFFVVERDRLVGAVDVLDVLRQDRF